MDPLTGSAAHDLITFGVLRYIVGHKALDPVAGVRAAVEKRRHRSTEVWSMVKAGGPLQTQHSQSALTLQGYGTD